ncbi:extensin-like domain-containing protein [Aestuariivirga litoralis]|uniref:extensin-like domain-containing protein n=1 Tax=Aestuariivirga litoralis TaxID=2650924 RepID=UPI0018C82941|nr:extensin family protein [Aestuariivirga litoralis]MBG1231976.1 extensin family protein [Aestuariivirga litoralis]
MTLKPARLFAGAGLTLLAACSTGPRSAQFTLEGVQAPKSTCAVDPQSFAQATPLPDIEEGNGCRVSPAYKISAVNDVQFSPSAVVNCDLADSVSGWITRNVQPAAQAAYGQKVVSAEIASSYACRARDNIRGAKLSEHGFGNAIDFGGFTLADGREVSVVRDYYGKLDDQQFLHRIRQEACGPFHTVLGPGSDRFHKDHIHLDLQHDRRGGGPYCH